MGPELSQLCPLISGAGIPTPASAGEKTKAANAIAATILNSDANFFLIPSMVDRPFLVDESLSPR
jgi:hypothetical protein